MRAWEEVEGYLWGEDLGRKRELKEGRKTRLENAESWSCVSPSAFTSCAWKRELLAIGGVKAKGTYSFPALQFAGPEGCDQDQNLKAVEKWASL